MTAMRSSDTAEPGRAAIVMLTDFGVDSFYVGAMKAAALAVDPGAVIVDLTHGVRPFAVEEASFVLSLVFELWAEGTVFVVVVDPGVGGDRQNLVVESRGRYVVGPDNGSVSDVAAKFGVESVFAIAENRIAGIRKHHTAGRTFLGRDVFAPAAAFVARGGKVDWIGERIEGYRRLPLPEVEVGAGYVRGQGRYVDGFGNVLTNISRDHLVRGFANTPLDNLRVNVNNTIGASGVWECFSQGPPGELIAILDSWDLIELSVNQGRAVDRFAAGRPVVVELTRARGG